MMRLRGLVLLLFLAVTCMATRAQKAKVVDPDLPVITGDVPGGRACTQDDWKLAHFAQKRSIVKRAPALLPLQTCRAVSLASLPSARIVQFKGAMDVDYLSGVTILEFSPKVAPTVIVFDQGPMVADIAVSNGAQEREAFNRLLRVYDPNRGNGPLNWTNLAMLYMFSIGHPYRPRVVETSDVLMVNDILSMESDEGSRHVVTLHQVPELNSFASTENYFRGEWVLTFVSQDAHVRLESVKREHEAEERK